jgi:hypothetical protein
VLRLCLVCLTTLVPLLLVSGVHGSDGALPWASGASDQSPFELTASRIAGVIANRADVEARCEGETEWATLAADRDQVATDLLGYVQFTYEPDDGGFVLRAGSLAELSPRACWHAYEYAKNPNPTCQTGTERQARRKLVQRPVKASTRVRIAGRWVTRSAWKKRNVQITTFANVPVYGPCPPSRDTVFGLWTLAHEAVHLSGVVEEDVTDCYGLQWIPWAATQFGASPEYASMIGAKAWSLYQVERPQLPAYYSTECREDGALDRSPGDGTWP